MTNRAEALAKALEELIAHQEEHDDRNREPECPVCIAVAEGRSTLAAYRQAQQGAQGEEPTFTQAQVDAIYAAWHGAGVDIAGGNWKRFAGMLAAAPTQPAPAAGQAPSVAAPVARIDPMQDPMRPGYFMNYAQDETPAEMVLRKLACWLGVGGFNAPTVDAEQFHRKIVDGVQEALVASATRAPQPEARAPMSEDCHGLDTPERVRFYEHDFYVLSNFSAFSVRWEGMHFPTSEHAYHWAKFGTQPGDEEIGEWAKRESFANGIHFAKSAHAAFKAAEAWRAYRRPDWDAVKVDIMRDILRAKVQQHEYVRRKLLATGDRELVEDSWRDDYWGWGPNQDGQNMLGKLWMEVRSALRAEAWGVPLAGSGGD